MKRFTFVIGDCGDAAEFRAEVIAESDTEAVRLLKEAIPRENVSLPGSVGVKMWVLVDPEIIDTSFIIEDQDIESVIKAEVHDDDRIFEAEFDATSWFDQAEDDEILELARCGWGNDAPSDWVARFCRDTDRHVDEVLSHVGRERNVGFECSVNEEDALRWVAKNRPGLMRSMTLLRES